MIDMNKVFGSTGASASYGAEPGGGDTDILAQLEQRLADLTGKQTTLTGNIGNLQFHLNRLQGKPGADPARISDITSRIAALQGNLARVGQHITDVTTRIERWKNRPKPPVPPEPPGPPEPPVSPGGDNGYPDIDFPKPEQAYRTNPEAGVPESIYGGYPPSEPAFPYPSQWGTASNVLTQIAKGLPTAIPDIWQTGGQYAADMAFTGKPTSYEPAYQASKKVVQQDILDAIRQAGEEAGVSGLRYSSVYDRTSKDIAGRRMAELGAQWTGQELGAQEAARGRQLEGINQMYQYGTGTTGLAEAAKNRAIQATGGLSTVGQQYANLPMDWAQNMYGMGMGAQGLEQGAYDRVYQEFLRTVPENSPYYAMAQEFLGRGNAVPTTYQPGAASNLMSLLPLLLFMIP